LGSAGKKYSRKEADRSDQFDCLDLFFSLFSKQAASTRYARNFVIAGMPGTFSGE